jgi:hypothetical protein
VLRKLIERELPERIAHRQMVVELHPGFIRFSREAIADSVGYFLGRFVYWKAAEIEARKQRAERAKTGVADECPSEVGRCRDKSRMRARSSRSFR